MWYRQAFKVSVENELEQLQETIDADPSQQSCELYDLNKKELVQIEKEDGQRREKLSILLIIGKKK